MCARPSLAVLPLLWLAACAPVVPREPALDDLPIDACAPLSAGEFALVGSESAPGYDDELAALDLAALPASIPLAPASAVERLLVSYMIDEREPEAVHRDTALAQPLGRAVLGAFAIPVRDAEDDGSPDLSFLRRGLHRFYACERGLPLTLAAFNESITDVSAMAVGETIDSRVKGLPRRMRRSAVEGVFVAETLVNTAEGFAVRETEILLTDRRNDGAIEFLEYDAAGVLRSASSFATATGDQSLGAVPFTCIACHGTRDVTPPPQ